VPFDKYPNIKAYSQRLSARPSVKRVQEEAAPYLEAFEQKHAS
jgi:glutathione S-transferase